jgi:hypothetical protein
VSNDPGYIPSASYCYRAEFVGIVLRALLRGSSCPSDAIDPEEESAEDTELGTAIAGVHHGIGEITHLTCSLLSNIKEHLRKF